MTASPDPAPLPYGALTRLASAGEMRAMDRHAIESLGLPARLLMENAARAVAERAAALAGDGAVARPIVVCCGPGNNGGDGLAAARLLQNRGLPVTVLLLAAPRGEEPLANLAAWQRIGETVDANGNPEAAGALLDGAGVLVDAGFGTGLTRELGPPAAQWIERFNRAPAAHKVAVDIPSGIHSDTGQVLGIATRCTHTVALQAEKIGCHQWPGAAHCGRLETADISIPLHWAPDSPATYRLTAAFARELMPPRSAGGHKGSFGHVLSVCGSAGMGGAAWLAARAALKSGTGLVTAAVPLCLRDGFLATAPEVMTLAPPAGEAGRFSRDHADPIIAAAAERSAVILGCGLGREPDTGAFVRRLVEQAGVPLLLDADGLFAVDGAQLTARAHPTVITPHPGELARLSGLAVDELNGDRVGHARRLAADWGVVLVLKGPGTVIASPSGEAFINPVSDHALATGGSGDVLSGVIGGLLAQGLEPLPAALLGVYLHADARRHRRGLCGAFFSAGDLIGGLNGALKALGAD